MVAEPLKTRNQNNGKSEVNNYIASLKESVIEQVPATVLKLKCCIEQFFERIEDN